MTGGDEVLRKPILDALEALFRKHPVMRASGGASEEELDIAEQRLGCTFHAAYREFVVRFGGAMAGADPVYGLRPVQVFDAQLWSVVDVTLIARSQARSGVDGWYVFSDDGAGNVYGIATDGRVWISYHDAGTHRLVASGFEEWLRARLEI